MYDSHGNWQGQLILNTGQAFSLGELWGLSFGNGGSAGSSDILYFAAGLDGATNGLLGSISVESVPKPSTALLGFVAVGMLAGGWQLRKRRRLATS